MDATTIPQMFLHQCNKYGNKKAAYLYKKDGVYVEMTYQELKEKVVALAIGLLDLGIHSGDRVGILSENRIEWIISDFAIVGLGAIDVPIFPTLTAKQVEYIFNDCQVTAIIVSNNFQLRKVLEFKDRLPSLRHVFVMNEDFETTDFGVKSLASVIARGYELKTPEERNKIFEEFCHKVKPDDLLTLIYTSGTTGNPKGVMLTNNNIISNIKDSVIAVEFTETDVLLSYLPWCHSYERTTGFYTSFYTGALVAMAESVETVGANILEVRPTIMTTVPRLLEIVKQKIFNAMSKEPIAKQKIFEWAVKVGKEYIRQKLSGKINIAIKGQYRIADKLVFSKIREKTGGRIKKFVSGGAALPPDVCEFFLSAGLLVLEGYGLTEASPVVSVTDIESYEIGTIGKPLRSVEIKIVEDGEILVRGPNVMLGYWNDEQATKEAIDEEGWLYTGDVGKITEKGNIKITDRKKNIFVSSGGKNIAPQPIENLLTQSPYIERCVLVGNNREFVTALISPDFEQLKKLADNFELKYNDIGELINNPKIINTIKQDIDRLQKDLAKYERVRRFSLLSQPFTIENGELTPKMSIKRHVVERKYSYLIEQMYNVKG